MTFSSRMLGTALLLLPLIACDRRYEPGIDHYIHHSFAQAPPATRTEMERDSVSGGDDAYTPVGTGSVARSTAEAISMQPGGDPNTSKYTDSGTTDGSSTTSGRSLTNRGATDSEVPGTTRSQTTTEFGASGRGSGTGRGAMNNVPKETSADAAKTPILGNGRGNQSMDIEQQRKNAGNN